MREKTRLFHSRRLEARDRLMMGKTRDRRATERFFEHD